MQRQLSRRLTLGAETYYQGPQMRGAQQSTFIDGGGYYNFNENFSLLFMLGHTVAGENHTAGYLGLYWTWGRKSGQG